FARAIAHRAVTTKAIRRAVDLAHRPFYPGYVLHHVFYAIDLTADRACRTLELLAAADCARTGTCQDPDLTRCRSDSHRPASRHWVWDFCSCRTCGRLVAEGADGFAGASAQIYANEEIDGQGCASWRRNRKACDA